MFDAKTNGKTTNRKEEKTMSSFQVDPQGRIDFGGDCWRIIDIIDNDVLVISENVLFVSAYHSVNMKITWENSDIRQHLNGEFYDRTFSAEEKSLIVETKVSNKNCGTDKIWLLSIKEAGRYFVDSYARKVIAKDGKNLWWWLRSSSPVKQSEFCAAAIGLKGQVCKEGLRVDKLNGVRPAMWLNTNERALSITAEEMERILKARFEKVHCECCEKLCAPGELSVNIGTPYSGLGLCRRCSSLDR